MIYFLRNISIRLWLSVALAIPAIFIILPTIQRLVPGMNPSISCIIITVFLFMFTGYIMNFAGERAIHRYINDAKNWERDGIFNKSEACYLKALEIFDSYLFTTLRSRKAALILTGAIARFSLNALYYNDHFDKATTFFLNKNLHETEVAHLWLKKMVRHKSKSQLSAQEENLLTKLAEMEPLSLKLVPLLAEFFTKRQRSDFAAKRVFSVVGKNVECVETSSLYAQSPEKSTETKQVPLFEQYKDGVTDKNNLGEKISGQADLQETRQANLQETEQADFQEKRSQEEIYEQKEDHKKVFAQEELQEDIFGQNENERLNEISLSEHRYQVNRPFFARSRRQHFKMGNRPFLYTLSSAVKAVFTWTLSFTINGLALISSLPLKLISFIPPMVKFLLDTIRRSLHKFHHAIAANPNFRKNISRLILLIVITGVFMLIVNTVSHLFRTPSPPLPSTPKTVAEDVEVQVIPQKKFTIQVAAYLSKSHAEQYLKKLEKKGIAGGEISSVEGGGKTWYLIRIGQYETKESAAEYGNNLKSKGMVEDFFVDNSGG
ncbi:MAG: SPOR domain-containing protein [Desulfamplus sp.]|nr:SPOR domain-containing protein [Desulfamplus sp.]